MEELAEDQRRGARFAHQPDIATRLTLAEAKSLAKRMGLSDKAVGKLKLRPGMQQDAVFTLVRQHLRLAERKKRTVQLVEDAGRISDQ